jgi:hypothetical protein
MDCGFKIADFRFTNYKLAYYMPYLKDMAYLFLPFTIIMLNNFIIYQYSFGYNILLKGT